MAAGLRFVGGVHVDIERTLWVGSTATRYTGRVAARRPHRAAVGSSPPPAPDLPRSDFSADAKKYFKNKIKFKLIFFGDSGRLFRPQSRFRLRNRSARGGFNVEAKRHQFRKKKSSESGDNVFLVSAAFWVTMRNQCLVVSEFPLLTFL